MLSSPSIYTLTFISHQSLILNLIFLLQFPVAPSLCPFSLTAPVTLFSPVLMKSISKSINSQRLTFPSSHLSDPLPPYLSPPFTILPSFNHRFHLFSCLCMYFYTPNRYFKYNQLWSAVWYPNLMVSSLYTVRRNAKFLSVCHLTPWLLLSAIKLPLFLFYLLFHGSYRKTKTQRTESRSLL